MVTACYPGAARLGILRVAWLVPSPAIREAAEGADAAAEHAHHDRTGHAHALHSTPAIVQQAQKDERAGKREPAEQRRTTENAAEQTGQQTRRGACTGQRRTGVV